jgi:hypothetical protein
MGFLAEMVRNTNWKLTQNSWSPTSSQEFLKYLGLRLAMSVEPRRGGISAYFRSDLSSGVDKTIRTCPCYKEKFGMSESRFRQLTKCLQISHPNDISDDPWHSIRPFVTAFQQNMEQNFIPGKGFCIDEFMSMFTGDDVFTDGNADGLPHKTKLDRKPKGVGVECKCVCDIETGIMINFEIMEGKDRMAVKPFALQCGAGTLIVCDYCNHISEVEDMSLLILHLLLFPQALSC